MSCRRQMLCCFTLLSVLAATHAGVCAAREPDNGPQVQSLWPAGAVPKAVGTEDVDNPSITIYLPKADAAVGVGVVVCPGGSYTMLAADHEGAQIARWLNSIGIAAFVLKYRLGPRYRYPAALLDLQRAIRIIRHGASAFGVSSDAIGVWGFSAGGHLASTASTRFDAGNPNAIDPVDRISSRPDFAILAYPVISLATEYAHRSSVENLLGNDPDPELLSMLSNEKQVTRETPPTFLFHTDEDNAVPAENSVLYYMALRKAGVPAEMHVFQHGNHGMGLAPLDQPLSLWSDCLANWLKSRSWKR